MIRRPPRSTQSRSSAASDVYKRQARPFRDRAPSGHDSSWRLSTTRGRVYVVATLGSNPSVDPKLAARFVRPGAPTAYPTYARICHDVRVTELQEPQIPHSRVSARLGAIAESATLAVDAKAKALKAAGRPVIGFGAGEPDFPTPDYIVEAAQRAAADPKMHKYTPAAGLPELRQAIAAKTARDSGYQVSADQVLVTNGGKQAVYQTFAALLDDGDEALLPAPYWTTVSYTHLRA